MAEIVSIIGITHNPFMPRLFQQPQQPPGAAQVKERIAMMQQKLADANPDVLVCIGNDHLHQFFMDNMPAFMIGKMEQYNGTFYDEEREFGLPRCKLPGDLDAADAIMEGAFDRGVDFSYSNELTIDHSIAQALVEAKTISAAEARVHRYRNVLWKYLGSPEVGELSLIHI